MAVLISLRQQFSAFEILLEWMPETHPALAMRTSKLVENQPGAAVVAAAVACEQLNQWSNPGKPPMLSGSAMTSVASAMDPAETGWIKQ